MMVRCSATVHQVFSEQSKLLPVGTEGDILNRPNATLNTSGGRAFHVAPTFVSRPKQRANPQAEHVLLVVVHLFNSF